MSRRAASARVTRLPGPRIAAALALVAALSASLAASRPAYAQFTPTGLLERKADPEINVRRYRSGLVVSLMLGWGVAQAVGYPNDSNDIGNPAYFSSSNLMLGSNAGLFVGGALADYLNFGFFFDGQSYKSQDWKLRMSGFGFRVETFPLVYAVPKLKDLGIFAQFGIGSATLDAVAPGYPEAKGVQSFAGIGGMYEWTIFHLFGGHAVAGPTLEYDTVFSQPMTTSAGVLGARVAFYGGM